MSVEAFDSETDSMTLYAFRYCLGRETYAVSDCVTFLVRYWLRLTEATRALIKKEIKQAFDRNRYGSDYDRRMWAIVLDLQP